MGPMSFVPATITINAGEQVVWKNTSSYFHNVVDDPARALNRVDVSSPSGERAVWFEPCSSQAQASITSSISREHIIMFACARDRRDERNGDCEARCAARFGKEMIY